MNTLKNVSYKIFMLALLIAVASCASRQELVYFQDEPLNDAFSNLNKDFQIKFKPDDLLTIDVSALDPEAARPFNLPAVSYNASVIAAQGQLKMQTYLVDAKGNIEFPVLGTIKMGGLSRSDANAMLKERLSEYIKNPIVNIRLANFSITVLGEVNKPGTFIIQDERISLSEAIGLAGDMTIYGRRDNIFLIREIDGNKRYAKLDLSSINVVNSPNYYLTQNDVIYVEPNNARMRQANFTQNNTLIVSIVGVAATIAAILIK
ncbi:MAG: polysaccharide biosynthesis/export family protein [Bacteroidia bacterium]|nr:polysaccharide biosynthesis/export family protein [Bacteroidia bacterium]NNF82283.1 polysaccharide export protein [Flavobacteriaceae bacterium]MBT8268667.1 polysaccharide biosynthesis/export family protein [Bacteroidia bacterium]MBT8287550.1 polysaccharide biosynthesis/export family protein [Bacteroidia bacterium]NNK69814.1 polysaccharide export protein [Flavobacteriaceae bacterium]